MFVRANLKEYAIPLALPLSNSILSNTSSSTTKFEENLIFFTGIKSVEICHTALPESVPISFCLLLNSTSKCEDKGFKYDKSSGLFNPE